MTTYDINIETYDSTKSYKQDNLVINDGVFYQANKDIPAGEFNISDWTIVNDPDTLYNTKLFPDYLNTINDNKPSLIDISDNNEYTIICNENGVYTRYTTVNRGLTWMPKPISNYNNLSIYLLADKYYYTHNESLSKRLSELNINDGLIEIVFAQNFPYPITDNNIVHDLVFDNCEIVFGKSTNEPYITLSTNTDTWVLVDNTGTAQNILYTPSWLHWNPGTYTLEFDNPQILDNMKDGNGVDTTINNLPNLGSYIPYVPTWTNGEIIEISYNNKGGAPKILKYTPNDMIKQIIINNGDISQILNPVDKKISFPFVDTGSNKAGIVKPTSSTVSFVDGVVEVNNSTPTVYNIFDYGAENTNPNDPIWESISISDGKTLVSFQTKKCYTMYGGEWESETDLGMISGQCVFVDKMVVPTDEDFDFVPNVTWLHGGEFTYLNSDPDYLQHRTYLKNIETTFEADTNGVTSKSIQIPPIDEIDNIRQIRIKGSYTYTVIDEESEDHKIVSTETIPFNFNSLHGEFMYRYDDNNVNRMLIGLTYNPFNTVNLDDQLNEIYFISEPTGYVKSITTLKNYQPFFLPKEIYSTGFTKGIKLGAYPASGTGNVTLGWDFAPINAPGIGTSMINVGNDDNSRKITIKAEIFVEWED